MAIQSDETLVTKGDLKTLYTDKILPYLGGNMMMQTGVSDYYSEDEKVVGVWIDGKPVYQKTFTGTVTSASSAFTNFGTLSNHDKIICGYGMVNYSATAWVPITYAWSDSDRESFYVNSSGQVMVGGKYQGFAIITIRYTKTTDTASSALTTPGCYDINRPDLWPVNVEIFFGNGLYGSRITGSADLAVGSRQDVILPGSITNNTRLINQGGQLKTPNGWSLPLPMSFSLTYDKARMETFIYPLYTSSVLKLYMLVNNVGDIGVYNYDVWCTYTK